MTRRERDQVAQARAHPVAWILRIIARKFGSAEATPSQWLETINHHADEHARQSQEWPQTVNQLGRVARQLAPGLLLLGVEITFRRRGNARLWRIETAEQAAARRHYEATTPERKAARIARECEEKALFKAAKARGRKLEQQCRRKTR